MCSDPEATKGYDHNLDKYIMGYGLHFAATPLANNPSKCLPLTFFVTGAHTHDSKMTLPLLMDLYHNLKFDYHYVIADSGYDAWYIYWWINLLGGKPIITINPSKHKLLHLPMNTDCLVVQQDMLSIIGVWTEIQEDKPRIKTPSFRGTKNFFIRTLLICMLQHAKAIAETLENIEYQTPAA